MKALEKLKYTLSKIKSKNRKNIEYNVPALWLDPNKAEAGTETVKPYDFFLDKIDEIKKLKDSVSFPDPENWSHDAVIYNLFPRFAAAFDHNNDGNITTEPDEFGFRETGTFLKSIAMLPYLHSLGINTVYLLPVTSIGVDGRKGDLGSPYAIRNPYGLDENLSEPFLDMTVEEQFAAFVEAAHLIGMKVVSEFVFRTASIDSDLAIDHPGWFYWIKENIKDRKDKKDEKKYGSPLFNKAELKKIKEKVEKGDLKKLPEPHEVYKNMFRTPPNKVARVDNRIVGVNKSPDGKIRKKDNLRIPGAFADWPPDDNQPPWSDVTYLKMYDHPDFNYIAYNTVRMYDEKLAKKDNRVQELWDNIADIIPYYQDKFGIDGVMIDMGHSLPDELRSSLLKKARNNDPGFVFWEENFTLSEKSKEEGYDASLGYMPFDEHNPWKLKEIIKMFEEGKCPIHFFATPETHNTPRAASREGGLNFGKAAYAINKILPTMTFIHNGFELCEEDPVNTGLGFTDEQIEKYPPEKLPLFSTSHLDWNKSSGIIPLIRKINEFAKENIKETNSLEKHKVILLEASHFDVVSFIRRDNTIKQEVLFAGNFNPEETIECEIDLLNGTEKFTDEITNTEHKTEEGKLKLKLKPFEFVLGVIR